MKKIAKFSAFMVAAMFAATSFTSCGDENGDVTPNGGGDEELAEKVNFDGLKAIANSNGTIDIVGEITADKKLKSFVLINVETNEETSLGDKNTTTKEKEVDENGKKVKKFTMTVTGANVPVGIYKFKIKEGVKKPMESDVMGERYSFELGYGAKSTLGSYVSVVNSQSYTQEQVEGSADIAAKVEFVLGDKGLKPASEAKNAAQGKVNYGKYAKSAIFSGTIITSTGCIATYELKENADGKNGTMSGIIMKSSSILTIEPAAGITLTK
jgi:hypothetical protein